MPLIEIVEYIEAPPEKVWLFISDIQRGPEWVTVMKEVLYLSDGPVGEGTVYRERSKVGPSLSVTEWEITAFEPPRIQVHECSESALQAHLTLKVDPQGSGTRFTHRTDYRLMPVFRPLGWVLEKLFAHRTMTSEMQQTVRNAKRMLEAEQET